MINAILTLCVLIECWHMFYFGIFYDKLAHVHKVIDWAMMYKNMNKHYVAFAQEYIKEENDELRSTLGDAAPTIVQILEQIEALGGAHATSKILKLLKPKEAYLFLGQQAIEIVYWIFIAILLITLPVVGKILIGLILMMSFVQSKYNKSHDVALHVFDSAMCIAIFIIINTTC